MTVLHKSKAVTIVELIMAKKNYFKHFKTSYFFCWWALFWNLGRAFSVTHVCKICRKSLQIYFHPGWNEEKKSFCPGLKFTCDTNFAEPVWRYFLFYFFIFLFYSNSLLLISDCIVFLLIWFSFIGSMFLSRENHTEIDCNELPKRLEYIYI